MRRDPVGGAVFVVCLGFMAAILSLGAYFQFPPEDGPPPPAVTVEDKRLALLARLKEQWGIEKIQAHTVMVGPKFVSLTPDEKQRVLKYFASCVFVPPSDEPWEPDQTVMIVESATGKLIATITKDGPKLSE
jgi:hypothetical protein